VFTTAFGLIFLVHFIERVDNFIDGKIPLLILGKYYFYQIPYFASLGLPLSGMMASVITLAVLIRNSEFLAITALGYSRRQAIRSILVITLIMVPFTFWLNETLVTQTQRTILKIENQWLKKHRNRFRNRRDNLFFYQPPNATIAIGKYLTNDKKGENITIQYFENKQLIERFDASRFEFDNIARQWIFYDIVSRKFSHGDEHIIQKDKLIFNLFGLFPVDIAEQFYQSSEFSIWELHATIHKNKESGISTLSLETEWHFKIAFAFTIFIITFAAIPIVILTSRGNAGIGAGISLLLSFCYLVLINYAQIVAKAGVLSPFFTLWSVNFLFLASGSILFLKARK